MKKIFLIALFLAFVPTLHAQAASRFWVGGTGNWDAVTTTHWAASTGGAGGSSVPTSSDDITFDAASGGGAVTITASAPGLSLTTGAFTGTLNTNGQAVTITNACSMTGTGTRTLTLGASVVTCGNWDANVVTGLTFNSNTSNVKISNGNAFNGGGLTYATVTMNNSSVSVTGTNTFGTLTISPTSPTMFNVFTLLGNQTVTGTFTASDGATITNRILLTSGTIGTSRTITAATVSVSNTDFKDITGAGASGWNISAASGGSGDCGGNSGITFTTPVDQHWQNAAGGTWSTAANWTSRVPLPQDNVFMDKAFGTSSTVSANMPRLGKNIDWTGATFTTSLSYTPMANQTDMFGSLTLIAGLTWNTGSNTLNFAGRSGITIDTKGVTIAQSTSVNSGAATLASSITLPAAKNFGVSNLGTIDVSASNFVISAGSININSAGTTSNLGAAVHLLTGTGNVFNGGATTLYTGTFTLKINDTSNTANSFTGNGGTYYNIWWSRGASTASNTMSGNNTFTDFRDDGSAAHSILFTAASVTTVSTFTVSGTAGNLITINSTTTGTHSLVKTNGGTISCDFLNIQHSVATPSLTWYAGTNSTNNQATATAGSGWIFTAPPSVPTVKAYIQNVIFIILNSKMIII